jgi:hypothetical protein
VDIDANLKNYSAGPRGTFSGGGLSQGLSQGQWEGGTVGVKYGLGGIDGAG